MAGRSDTGLNILLTNICMRGRSGTEMMTAELAIALLHRGHRVVIYSPRLGTMAQDLRGRGVPVTDRIETIGFTPDIIHGHHNVVLAVAMVRFLDVPAIFVCHDSSLIHDEPILSPRIGAYVAVDLACADRLRVEGADPPRIHIIPNAVDLSHFHCRTKWSQKPLTALAVVKSRAPWLPTVRKVCAAMGITLTEVGAAVGNPVVDLPERMLASDIVFAWSRSASEAAATGAAVILCDEFGFGGLLSKAEADRFPRSNLGRRILATAVTEAGVMSAILTYDPIDAAAVAKIVRKKLSLDDMAETYEKLYHDVVESSQNNGQDTAGLAVFLERTIPRFDLASDLHVKGKALADRLVRLDAWIKPHGQDNNLPHQQISFSSNGLGPALLGQGWGDCEHWGVWSGAEMAVIDIPISIITAWGNMLSLDCGHYFTAQDNDSTLRAVEMSAGGRLLARWNFRCADYHRTDMGPLLVKVPPSLLKGPGSLRLEFRIYAPVCPLDTGDGEDSRTLGLFLRSIGPAVSQSENPQFGTSDDQGSPAIV